MKNYVYQGTTYNTLPDPFLNTSPITEDTWVALGGTIEDDGKPSPEMEFASACVQFRTVCALIEQFTGAEHFYGGFGEMAYFASCKAYKANPVMGNSLAIQWSATNEQCKYFGGKIGLSQPDWWYDCWGQVGLDLHDYVPVPFDPPEEEPEETPEEEPEIIF